MFRRRPRQAVPAMPDPRPAAPPDPTSQSILVVPTAVVATTHALLRPSWRAGVEGAALWAGVETPGGGVVTTVVTPALEQSAGNYRMRPGSLRRMSRHLSRDGLTVLAQVHTHPSAWVGHSRYDDAHAYSQRDGALSLVWPHYGVLLSHDLRGVGVHERRGGRWVQLDNAGAAARVRLVDSHADFRWEIERGDLDEQE